MPNTFDRLANPLRSLRRPRAPTMPPPSDPLTPQTPTDSLQAGVVTSRDSTQTAGARDGLALPNAPMHAAKAAQKAVLTAPPRQGVDLDVPLTRSTLKEWERAPGLSNEEAAARKQAAKLILDASKMTLKTGFKLNVQSLDLSSVKDLRSLPPGLVVHGDLDLSGLKGFTRLPPGLVVAGRIKLDKSGITALPDNLVVHGALSLRNCDNLTALPKGLVADKLYIDQCPKITELPADMRIKETLHMQYCDGLEVIPPTLAFPYNVDMSYCSKVRRLPDDVHISTLRATHCDALEISPKSLHVGVLDVSYCPLLRSFAEDSEIHTFKAIHCRDLAAVPTKVTGYCDISGSKNITNLPATFRPSSLVAVRCAGLQEIPVHLRQGLQCLDISESGVHTLPAGLEVTYFNAINAVHLRELPENLVVKDADISYSGVRTIPASIKVGHKYSEFLRNSWERPDTFVARNCPDLETIGAFNIHASFDVSGSDKLKALPPIKAYSITAKRCAVLLRVEDHYEVEMNLDVSDNPSLEHIGLGEVPGAFTARRCAALRVLDPAQKFNAGYFNHCVSLADLPHNLNCFQLDISDCISVERLPPNTQCRWALTAAGCINLETLAGDCSAGAKVDIRGCPRITGFSQAFLSRNDKRSDAMRLKVYTDGSGIDVNTLTEESRTIIEIVREARPEDTESPAAALKPTAVTKAKREQQYASWTFEDAKPLYVPKELWSDLACPFTLQDYEEIEKPLVVPVLTPPQTEGGESKVAYHVFDADNYDFGDFNTFFKHWVEYGTDPSSRAVLPFEHFYRGVKTPEDAEPAPPAVDEEPKSSPDADT